MAAGVLLCAQEPTKEPPNKATEARDVKPQSEKPAIPSQKTALPFQIELLETRVRFAGNGDSQKQVHTIVKFNDAGGARQFARLGFDYNRAFQSVEIPLVKVSHANGGTSEILPSAIGDVANPAVEKFPAYQDLRVKTVRILGLQEGDTLEYRVITTTTKPPLAPDFWLEHTFDQSGQVVEENYLLEVPKGREISLQANPEPQVGESDRSDSKTYSWSFRGELPRSHQVSGESSENKPDVVLTTFQSWEQLGARLGEAMATGGFTASLWTEAVRDTGAKTEPVPRNTLYDLVSAKIATVDLPLDFGKYWPRDLREILKSGYANARDKIRLLDVLLAEQRLKDKKAEENIWLVSTMPSPEQQLPRPSLFTGIFLSMSDGERTSYLDPSLEVAPFGAISSKYRGKPAFLVGCGGAAMRGCWGRIPEGLPYASKQLVNVQSTISSGGELRAKVKYVMRGDNELTLREAFHQSAKEQWNEVAGLLALSDGFRGHIESVKASDPTETEKPFEVEYEITQPKFVDWAKKPVRIPALLPQIALPDAPDKAGGKTELGTPLEVETQMTLRLPEGTTVETPPATSVSRDYATYASNYDAHLNTVTASRHIHFVLREIPGERGVDYNAFVRAVKNDEGQAIALFPPETSGKK